MNAFDWRSLRTVDVVKFSNGELSGRQFYDLYRNTPLGGRVRELLRTRGVDNSRYLAKRAVCRLNKVK